MNISKLKDKFHPHDLEWRVQSCGENNGRIWARVLTYVDARAVQDRLDEVCGPDRWQTSYEEFKGGIICHLSIQFDRGSGISEWVTKSDGAQATDVEPFKGSISKALVRAASQWNIGRYLYSLEASFANIVERGHGAKMGKTKEGKVFYWTPPELPKWALPGPVEVPATSYEGAKEPDKKTAVELMQEKANELHESLEKDKREMIQPAAIYCLCKKKMIPSHKGDFLYCPDWKDKKHEHKNPIPVKI